MYNLLLVDDEPLIKVAFQSAVEWGKNGFLLAATASNGQEALHIVETQHIDTSFTVTSLSIVVLSISAAWSAIVQDTAVSGFAAEQLSQPAHPYHTYRGSQHSVAVQ